MKPKSLLLGLLFFALVLPGPGLAKSGGGSVELGMLDKSLKDAQGTAIDAFAHEENQIKFDQPGVKKYDAFFKEVAIVSGTVTEVKFVLNQIDEGKLTVADAEPVLDFGLKALPEVEDRIPALIDEAKGFNPVEDFPGFRNKLKIPAVTAGLVDASNTLKESATEVPDILQELKAVTEKAGL